MNNFHSILVLPSNSPGAGLKQRRGAMISEALTWPAGSIEEKIYHELFSQFDFAVKLGKPGKEAAKGYKKININDMTPTIFYKNEKINFTPTFYEIFEDFQDAAIATSSAEDSLAMELLAAILFRSAFMLDHVQTEHGNYKWNPNQDVIEELNFRLSGKLGKEIETKSNGSVTLPPIVYLNLVEALAINEDVKYQAETDEYKQNKLPKNDAGRKNTLLTCVHVIGVILGRIPVHELMGSASNGRGVAPLGIKRALEAFPILKPIG